MVGKGQSGSADSHQLVIPVMLMDKMQRDQRSMVQLFFPLSLCTHGKIILPAEFVQFPYESFVIYGFFPCLRGHELAKVSPGFLSRRYMEIVRVHHRMRRNHHNGIRLQLRCHPGCLLVCFNGILNENLLPSAHLRHNQRRMGHHDSSNHSHNASPFRPVRSAGPVQSIGPVQSASPAQSVTCSDLSIASGILFLKGKTHKAGTRSTARFVPTISAL